MGFEQAVRHAAAWQMSKTQGRIRAPCAIGRRRTAASRRVAAVFPKQPEESISHPDIVGLGPAVDGGLGDLGDVHTCLAPARLAHLRIEPRVPRGMKR